MYSDDNVTSAECSVRESPLVETRQRRTLGDLGARFAADRPFP